MYSFIKYEEAKGFIADCEMSKRNCLGGGKFVCIVGRSALRA